MNAEDYKNYRTQSPFNITEKIIGDSIYYSFDVIHLGCAEPDDLITVTSDKIFIGLKFEEGKRCEIHNRYRFTYIFHKDDVGNRKIQP